MAFDVVSHNRLLKRMQTHIWAGSLLLWTAFFLQKRYAKGPAHSRSYYPKEASVQSSSGLINFTSA